MDFAIERVDACLPPQHLVRWQIGMQNVPDALQLWTSFAVTDDHDLRQKSGYDSWRIT